MLSLDAATHIDINGSALACVEEGTGDPVVLVHGGVSDLRTWSNQIGAFAERFRTLAYSRRFARPNAEIAAEADDPMQVHVDDLAGLIAERGAAPAHVVGHSWGGFIALLLGIQRPDLVRSLVLIEPPVLTLVLDMPPKPSQLLPLMLRDPKTAFAIVKLGAGAMGPAESAFRKGDDEAAIKAFGTGVLGKARFQSMSKERYQQVWDNRAPDRAQMLGVGFPPLSEDDVRTVKVPVLLVCGDESPPVFRRLAEHLEKLLPDARLSVVAGASHIVQEDAPDVFNAEVLAFLAGVDG